MVVGSESDLVDGVGLNITADGAVPIGALAWNQDLLSEVKAEAKARVKAELWAEVRTEVNSW